MRSPAWDSWVAKARAVRIEDEIARRGIKLNGHKVEREGPCPKCGGDDRFSINTTKQVFNCRGCGIKGNVIALVECLDGVDFKRACETLTGEPPPKPNGKGTTAAPPKKVVAKFPYYAADGTLAFIVERIEYQNPDGSPVTKGGKRKKTFRSKRPDPDQPGKWIWDTNGVPTLIYRLPEVSKAIADERVILVVEGEGCADDLWKLGIPATTNARGAGKWTPEHSEYLAGANVVLVPDHDDAGHKHMQEVGAALSGIASRIRVLLLLGSRPKGDVIDWLAVGGTREALDQLVEQAPDWQPAAADKTAGETEKAKANAEADEQKLLDELTHLNRPEADDDTEQVVKKKHADTLVDLAASAAKFFHTSADDAYADVTVAGHRETHRERSKSFRLWLLHRYYEHCAGAPNSDAVQSALNVLEARARFDGSEIEVHLRVAEHEGKVYLDLTDEGWRAVEIDAEGWRIVSPPPVRFRRAPGMRPLPEPVRGGSINALRSLLNVRSDADFVLTVAWLLAALRGRGPYPVMVSSGEHGTAKTTFCKVLRALIDPNTAPMRALPREDRDLFIAANNGYVLAFDNVSGLPAWISDTLCRLATGGGFSTRQLFSDDAEILFDAMRPIVLNGIEDFATRPDLVDRAILLTLEEIPDDKRRLETEVWAELYRKRPQLLGVLLDVVAHGLRELPNVQLAKLPRMADFAMWATACETALWPTGTFMAAYEANREDAVGGTIEADLVATAMRAFMASRTAWEGTASLLLDALGELITETQRRGKNWPSVPHHLTGRLRRAAPALRGVGIVVRFVRDMRVRTIHVTHGQPEEEGKGASLASSASLASKSSDLDMTLADAPASSSASCPPWGEPEADAYDAHDDAQGGASVMDNPLKEQGNDAHDAHDAHFPTSSADALRCDHCGQPASPANPLSHYDWPPDRPEGIVLLHPGCEHGWMDAHR